MSFTVAVVGSRDFPDLARVAFRVKELYVQHGDELCIISGEARGVDYHARLAALRLGIPYHGYPADWKRLGRRAGHVRNALMVMAADYVVAFWDGTSPGTQGTIREAQRMHVPYEVHLPPPAERITIMGHQ